MSFGFRHQLLPKYVNTSRRLKTSERRFCSSMQSREPACSCFRETPQLKRESKSSVNTTLATLATVAQANTSQSTPEKASTCSYMRLNGTCKATSSSCCSSADTPTPYDLAATRATATCRPNRCRCNVHLVLGAGVDPTCLRGHVGSNETASRRWIHAATRQASPTPPSGNLKGIPLRGLTSLRGMLCATRRRCLQAFVQGR